MVAAISSTASTDPTNPKEITFRQNPTRPPLLPSEKDNGVSSRRPKSKEVTSRYLSSSTSSSSSSRRCPSPLVSRSSTPAATPSPSVVKRSQSVERRRCTTPRPTTPIPDSRPSNAAEASMASKVLITSRRSLSVSFQGESFSLPISKTKATPPTNLANVRKTTPERRRTTPLRGGKVDGGGDQMENSKAIDQHRWPGRIRQMNMLTRSLDCTEVNKKFAGSGSVVQGLRASFDGRLHLGSSNAALVKSIPVMVAPDADLVNESAVPADLTASDTESVSSGGNSGGQECGGGSRGRNGPRGNGVAARFWQETNSRMRRLQEPGSPLSTSASSRTMAPPKLIPSKKSLVDNPLSSPRTGLTSRASSPFRGPVYPVSPSKLMTSSISSPSRGMHSPSQVRNGMIGPVGTHLNSMPSILSFPADARRGKMGENRIVDAHLLRLLYNRQLQWRFVNARADAALLVQRLTAEKNLYNAWVITSELRDSVTVKRIKLQLLRQNLKLNSILKGQITFLEEWAILDRDHLNSLSGAIESLKASTLRLPVVGGARADIQNVKDAVGSAVDVMQAMASSICSLLSKVEEVNYFVAELANMIVQERALLDQCKNLLSTLAAIQVKDCSLRTHILQLTCVPTRNTITQL